MILFIQNVYTFHKEMCSKTVPSCAPPPGWVQPMSDGGNRVACHELRRDSKACAASLPRGFAVPFCINPAIQNESGKE